MLPRKSISPISTIRAHFLVYSRILRRWTQSTSLPTCGIEGGFTVTSSIKERLSLKPNLFLATEGEDDDSLSVTVCNRGTI
ncbi:hypothetical protein L1887_34148 [Cichorium endivia]|nr:hypothetical protein L1887_34148 [Cichorium endivia]